MPESSHALQLRAAHALPLRRLRLRNVYFLILPNAHILDLAGPLQILTTLAELRIAPLVIECIGPLPALRAFQNVSLRDIQPLPARLEPGAVVFVVGSKLDDALMESSPWAESVAWLRNSFRDGAADAQVCGVCTGTFLLAQAGLLDQRVCTTHHRFLRQLRRRHPEVHVVDNRVLVRDGNAWTSAGVASGIDLALQLIAQSHGEDAAVQVARENVVYFRRFGSDPELMATMRHRGHGNPVVHEVQDSISRHLSQRLDVDAIARRFGMSARHLGRIFVAETGITLKQYQIELRIDLARRLLVGSALPLERIAERCGFASVQAFRANWNRREPLPPSRLRDAEQRG